MDVSVIIVTYNTMQMTHDCIESIFEKTKEIEFEVILVDNASSDGSRDFFAKDQRIKYIYSSENLGFGKGNNLGVEYASGKYIFYLNSDTLLLNNAIKEFFVWMEQQPLQVGCCGCMLLDANNNPVNSFQDMQGWFYFLRNILAWYHVRIKPKYNSCILPTLDYPRKVGFVVGADLFVRRECLDKCGQFDSDFFMYYEETEMQSRFHRGGFESWCINTPKIKHLVGQSVKKDKSYSLRRFIGQLESRYLYIRKVFRLFDRYFIYFIHLFYLPILPFKKALPGEKKKVCHIILEPFIKMK